MTRVIPQQATGHYAVFFLRSAHLDTQDAPKGEEYPPKEIEYLLGQLSCKRLQGNQAQRYLEQIYKYL